jgi:hypothetical protein
MKIQKFISLKKILIVLLLCISASQSIAQNSNGIFFQAVARDNFSNPAKDRNIYVESSIIQTTVNGTKVLVELHKTKTDAMGVFNITIGNGQRTGGSSTSIATIDWSKGPFYLNLKIAITPFSASDSWDYSKELVDIGTTSFGAVPFAFYSASSAKVSDKLDATDTTKMLAVYAKAMAVQSLATDVSTKLTAADTLTMLAPYAKAAYTIDSNFFRSQLATKLNIVDTINYTKQKYTDSAFLKKLNIADSSSYVTPSKLAANLFDQTPLKNEIATKLNIADSTKYVTLTKLAANLFDQTPLKNEIATKLNIADSSQYVTPTKLASYYTSSAGSGTTIDTASLSNRINLKASTSDVTNAIALNTSTITTNTNAITANTTAIASEATTARAAELLLTNTLSSNTTNISSNTASITANTASISNLNSNIASNTSSITANSAEIITNRANIATNTSAITANANAITANTTAIAAEATTARAAELVLTNNVSSNTASITSNTSAIAANTASILTNSSDIELKAPIISPIFTGTPTAPTAAAGISTTQLATTEFVNNATLNINASSISGTVALSQGGTGQTTIAGIKSVLGLASSKVAIGATSGATLQGSGAVAIGNGAGQTSQGANTVALGYVAGSDRQGASSIAIGVNAAQYTQGTNAVAIGDVAGQISQGAYSVAIGSNSQSALNAVAIGGYSTSSFTNSIAIGYKATTTAANTIQLGGDGVVSGSTAITNVKTTGTLTAGSVTYPNAHNSTAGQLLSINATGTAAWTTPASSGGGTHAIGEVYGGGIVFYVWDGGAHGLIAPFYTTSQMSTNPVPPILTSQIALNGTLRGITADGLLAGKMNTTLIISNQGSGTYAASYCYKYRNPTSKIFNSVTYTFPIYSDWYLPSIYEIGLFRAYLWNYHPARGSYINYGNNVIYYLGTTGNGNDYAWGKYISSTMDANGYYYNNYVEGNTISPQIFSGGGETDRLVCMPIRSF